MLWISVALIGGIASAAATSRLLEPIPVGDAVAPDPRTTEEAVVQVYGADVRGFRGFFAIHTWVATKARDAETYTIYQVIGWHLRRHGTVLSITEGRPDRPWFRSPPKLLFERRGGDAAELVSAIHEAALSYPHQNEYTMWPGPNSNSFTAWIGLRVPELGLQLPAKAIGKSWMQNNLPDS
tara:strand:+ start:494 stop:1036 length:543 start_codon:yes stop_codon:yes gene_type:complete